MSAHPDGVEAERPAFTHRQILVILTGIILGILISSLDQTIVATALPTIAGDLGGLSHLSWVVSAYLLTSTTSTPLWGRFSDIYGRKTVYQSAISIFLLGSALAGFAHTMNELIVFRAVQGMGAGGIFSGALSILGDILSPRERGRYQGYTLGAWTIAAMSGPFVGGLFTEHLSWRWCFYVNLPIGLVALVVTAVVLNLNFVRIPHRIDWLGAALLVGGVAALILVTVWGGSQEPWLSPVIIGLLLGGLALIGCFIYQERRAPEPILPLRLFKIPTFRLMNSAGILVSIAMFGTVAYLPLFLQIVTGVRPTLSGLLLMPQSIASTMGGIVVGRRISTTGHYKRYPVIGSCLVPLGLFLLSTMTAHTAEALILGYMVIFGCGLGMLVPVMAVAVQNAVAQEDLGVATSSLLFFRQLGAAFGVALFGSVMTWRLAHYFPLLVPVAAARRLHLTATSIALTPAAVRALPPPVRAGIVDSFARSLDTVFLLASLAAIVMLLTVLRVKELPLRSAAFVKSATRSGMSELEGLEEPDELGAPSSAEAPGGPDAGGNAMALAKPQQGGAA